MTINRTPAPLLEGGLSCRLIRAASHRTFPAVVLGLLFSLVIVVPSQVAQATDLTFFFTADTHYGLDLWVNNEQGNKATIDAMNNLPGTAYPASIGGTVATPSGVLVAGDLTDTPERPNAYGFHVPGIDADGFNEDYAVDGSGRIKYPVYEGYGNHDVDNTTHSYTLDMIRERNLVRPGITDLSANGLNYSWDWQGIHFINLNIYPGMNDRSGYSLQFLQDDLAHYTTSNTPIIIMQHFGFDSFSLGWWTDAERQAFADTIAGHNILGIFHGHLHTTLAYQWDGYNVFDGSAAKDGNFLVVHITDGKMTVVSREDNHWGFAVSDNITLPEPSTFVLAGLCALMGACYSLRRR
ncbi:MAG TPA: hypothetical protein VHD36_21750 [Pirellulales bacterium]|nr:hypothetical protein [Pirellulales bacterium]